jgi:hypothetical protein
VTAATWTVAEIPADRLAVGDLHRRKGMKLPVQWVETEYDHTRFGVLGRTIQVERDHPINAWVPDEPVDGYNLWKPRPHTFMNGCTCIHRHNPQHPHNWEPIGNNCPACVRLAQDDWAD